MQHNGIPQQFREIDKEKAVEKCYTNINFNSTSRVTNTNNYLINFLKMFS